jgi:hypothetical protein
MPIVVINTSFARAMQAAAAAAAVVVGNEDGDTGDGAVARLGCACGAVPPSASSSSSSSSSSSKAEQKKVDRYFGSHDYNAGRHASTASEHKGSCPMWRPSTTSHLHSWRRGFTEPEFASK